MASKPRVASRENKLRATPLALGEPRDDLAVDGDNIAELVTLRRTQGARPHMTRSSVVTVSGTTISVITASTISNHN
jgi:hypothetical protein